MSTQRRSLCAHRAASTNVHDDRADREHGVMPWKRLNAPPRLRVSSNSTVVADDVRRAVGERDDRPRLRELVEGDDRGDPADAQRAGRAVGASVRSSAPLAAGLALHALHGPRDHLEPGERDAVAARDAQTERAVGHLAQRAVDVVDRLRAVADSARSRSRSTLTVSPSPDSSSNCVSPCSRSLASRSASA